MRLLSVLLVLACAPAGVAQTPSLWAQRAKVAQATPEERKVIAESWTKSFGRDALAAGTAKPRIDGLLGLWAASATEPCAVGEYDANDRLIRRQPMQRLTEGSPLQYAFVDLTNFTDHRYAVEVRSGETWAVKSRSPLRVEYFPAHPDGLVYPGVPVGTVVKQPTWKSTIFAGTERDWWVYTPAQYSKDRPACVMIFQDGEGYMKWVAPMFDNLIHRGEMPVTVGIFISPGTIPKPGGQPVRNRSVEYDTLSDAYARFLRDEILPEVGKSLSLRSDAAARAIAGRSSGGICAFTAAWEMPDQFGKVCSTIGSFTNIRGGDVYPGRIRKTSAKPIRVFLQDGSNDLDNEHGNWFLGNQQMAKAMAFKGYDYKFVTGEGFHSGRHEQAIFPDALRWLWRDTNSRP